jgi:hypothetical protein
MLMAISHLVGRSMELTAALMAHARINEASLIDVDGSQLADALGEREDASRTAVTKEEMPSSTRDRDSEGDGARDSVSRRQSIAYILS